MIGVKHTPWEVEDLGLPEYLDGTRSRFTVRSKSGAPIAYAFDADEARLFAAAPDLLEAGAELQAARKAHKLAPSAENLSRVRIASDAFDAALARARGEQDGGGE